MAAFAFIRSLDGKDLPSSETLRQKVSPSLHERSPGSIQVQEWPDAWGAFSGGLGDLTVQGKKALFCDGFPDMPGGFSGKHLFDALNREGPALGHLEESEGHGPAKSFLDGVLGSVAACYYDGESGEVFLLRDRIGIRPVYYAEAQGFLFVASEPAILQALGLQLDINDEVLAQALRYRWVTEERCLFSPVAQVPPGTTVFFKAGQPPRPRRYWRFRTNRDPSHDGAMEEYTDQIEEALRASIRKTTRVGKKAGLLLSGGVDSSILAALCKQELDSIVAYSGWIPDFPNPEFERAKFVTEQLGVEFRPVEIDINGFRDDFAYIGNRVQTVQRHVNSLVLLQLVRKAAEEVDVLIQGDAADTLLGLRVSRFIRLFREKKRRLRWVPRGIQRMLARMAERVNTERAWEISKAFAWTDVESMRYRGNLIYSAPVRKILGISNLHLHPSLSGDWPEGDDLDELRRIHLLSTGIDGSLIRHDRMTRPEGLESHTPFLTPEVVDVASRLPKELTYQEVSKPGLRTLCDRLLPPEVSRWGKVGFEVPEEEWLFGVLQPLFQDAATALPPTGILPPEYFQAVRDQSDAEGVTTGINLYLVMKKFGLLA